MKQNAQGLSLKKLIKYTVSMFCQDFQKLLNYDFKNQSFHLNFLGSKGQFGLEK